MPEPDEPNSQSPESPPAEQQLLRETVFGPDSPGPVVHDFQAVLDLIGEEGLEAGGKNNLLPIKVLADLNSRMYWQARVELQRPKLESYPNLQGLYLLARATGLVTVRGAGDKARLARDPSAYDDWTELNDTEKYFTLLDAWLLHARAGMIGERPPIGFRRGFSYDDESFLPYVLYLWQRLGAKGKKISGKQRADANALAPVDRDRYTMVLMALFGLLRIEQGKPIQGRPWIPTAIHRTPFGEAVVSVLEQLAGHDDEDDEDDEDYDDEDYDGEDDDDDGDDEEDEDDDDEEDEEDAGDDEALLPATVCFNRLRPLFQPYVPAWRESLCVPGGGGFRDGAFVFKASWGKGTKAVWRRIAAPARATLTDLAYAVLDSYKFDDDHLWSFYFRDRFGNEVEVQHDYADTGTGNAATSAVLVGEVPLEPGESMTFLFDYGDEWRFDLLLERIDPPAPSGKSGKSRARRPKLLEKHGKAPDQYPGWDE